MSPNVKLKNALHNPTADLLEEVVQKNTNDVVYVRNIILNMNRGGFAILMLIFSLPLIIPILPPPIPSLIGIPLWILSCQMMLGFKSPKIPKFIANQKIKRELLARIIEKSVLYLHKTDRIIKPRLEFFNKKIFERILGFFIFIFTSSILIPIPFSNFFPGIAILIISFGLLSRDGLFILIGFVIGLFGICLTIFVIIFGIEALMAVGNIIAGLI